LDHIVHTTSFDYAECIERLRREGKKFQFVFIDAPYADGTASLAAKKVFQSGILADGGRVFLEHAANLPPNVDCDAAITADTRRYGTCAITIYERR
jgi:16S rRNA G966 N2-methylase RsmD